MTVEEARAVLDGCMHWIGWEEWESYHEQIVLDGRYTLAEVEAILTLMKHDTEASHG